MFNAENLSIFNLGLITVFVLSKQVLVRITVMLIFYVIHCVDESLCFAYCCEHHELVVVLDFLWTDNSALVTSKPCWTLWHIFL
jgi:hypothetical protein